MPDEQRFPYLPAEDERGQGNLRPAVPLMLSYGQQSSVAVGLLDTGATVNVLPYRLGLDLGASWSEQATIGQLTGNLAKYEARGVILSAKIGQFAPVDLVFPWTQALQVPLLLGQVNFFLEYDVCFFRSRRFLSLRPKISQ